MRRHLWKRILSCFLVIVMMATMFPSSIAEGADEGVTVNIESFMRGNVDNLRAGELLVANVEGYEGHVADLTYKWTNNLGTTTQSWLWGTTYYGTYLYVYSSHNMYAVQGTEAEQEIYNSDRQVASSSDMEGKSHDKAFAGVGYMYAAVYDANTQINDYSKGSITVEVYDGDALLAQATYSGFLTDDLEEDLKNAAFGVFEGETVEVKDLLGESAILHVNCSASTVTAAKVTDGSEHISVSGSAPNYLVTGLSKGEATIEISVKKGNCKFHQYKEDGATPKVYVFKKPVVTADLTTLTLTNLDPDCTYYIGHKQGVRSADGETVVFEGLTPSTTYEIEVKGRYYTDEKEEKYAYAFVNGTTLTPNTAAVIVLLDREVVTIDAVGVESLHLKALDADGQPTGEAIPLTYQESSHNYTAQVGNGIYWIFDEGENRISDYQEIVINNADASSTASYFSVNYDTNGGTLSDVSLKSLHYVGDTIHATAEIPVKEGYHFSGWKYNDSLYPAGSLVSTGINEKMTLVAEWEEAIDVYVNFTINHIAENGRGQNNDNGKHDITFTVDGRESGNTGDYTELKRKTMEWDGVSGFEVEGYDANHEITEKTDVTTYTAVAATFKDMSKNFEYTVTTAKSGYSITCIESTTDEAGNVILDVELIYYPNEFDFTYIVELDDKAKAMSAEVKPVAAHVKVTSWYDSPYVDGEEVSWYTISQHAEVYERIELDSETGKGTSTYPVWIETTDKHSVYYYRIEVVSYEMPDGTILNATDKESKHIEYVSSDERYTATIEVTDGKDPIADDGITLTGAWYKDGSQQGQVKAVISIKGPTLITIQGTVTAEYFYDDNGVKTYFDEAERIAETEVLLRRRLEGTDNFVTVAEQKVYFDVTQTESSTVEFKFEDIPDSSETGAKYEYVIEVRQTNYNKEYTQAFSYEAYTVEGIKEIRNAAQPIFENNVGTAKVLLTFAPENFELPFIVDVTQIADPTVQPIHVKVAYEYAVADSDFQVWNVILQHTGDNMVLDADFEEGYAKGSYPVWKMTPDGKYEYLYRLKVTGYTLSDGTEIEVGSEEDKLFNIYHNSPVSYDSEDPTIKAIFSPLPIELTLDTALTDTHINATGYTDAGASSKTKGELYTKTFVYGAGVQTLPTPVKEEYSFEGWYDEAGNLVTSVPSNTTKDVYLTARWEEGFTVNFHANNPHVSLDVFRSYYEHGVTVPKDERYTSLTESGMIPEEFYDIPEFDYETHNNYIFKGWYLDPESDTDPLEWDTKFEGETNIYAHWIEVGTVEQHEADTKESNNNGVYSEYDLIGAQIREAENDSEEHYGTAGSGLRFITVLSERVYNEINALDERNINGAEYGFLLANASKAQTNAESSGDQANYQLQYNHENVNGVNTTTDYGYVKNLKCSGVKDHFNCNDYRLYTAVVTYKNKTGETLAKAQATELLARPYIRYYDANELCRTYYNNYTGTPTYHGLSTSYSQVYEILNETN